MKLVRESLDHFERTGDTKKALQIGSKETNKNPETLFNNFRKDFEKDYLIRDISWWRIMGKYTIIFKTIPQSLSNLTGVLVIDHSDLRDEIMSWFKENTPFIPEIERTKIATQDYDIYKIKF